MKSLMLWTDRIVDEMTHKVFDADVTKSATPTAVYGPFYREDTPFRENGSSIIVTDPGKGEKTYMHGVVTDCTTGKPVSDAVVHVWQSSTNGLYVQQDADQKSGNLCGRFRTDKEGRYAFYCLHPTPYPIPDGNVAAYLLDKMDRHKYRPAHIHILVAHDSFSTLCTQIFPKDDPYLKDDAAFAVVESLVMDFAPRKGDPKATLELEFDVKIAPKSQKA